MKFSKQVHNEVKFILKVILYFKKNKYFQLVLINFIKFQLYFLFLILTTAGVAIAQEKNENNLKKETDTKIKASQEAKFIIVPLPFYGPDTGFGLSLKILQTNLYKNIYFDSLSLGTSQKQYATFNEIGQTEFSFYNPIFWSFQVGGTHLRIEYYGQGNENSLDHGANYMHQSYILTTKVGYTIAKDIKFYLIHSHKMKNLKDFEDPFGYQLEAWESLKYKRIKETRLGYGFLYSNLNSEVRPRKGIKISYEYLIANPWILTNTYSFREGVFSFAYYFPIINNVTHGTQLYYHKVSDSAPFYEDPNIRVRGIEKKRHKDKTSFVIQSEEHIGISKYWMIVPFFDFGRVLKNPETKLFFKDLHLGYGLGGRYIIKEKLVVRMDIAFSKDGESSFIFNYGHTF